MPELPEVESTVRYLRDRVVSETIVDCRALWSRSVQTHTERELKRAITGASITSVNRRGKFIELVLDGTHRMHMFIHLRMSGSLDVISSKIEIDRHDRVVFHLSNGKSVRFNDTRKFGRIYLCSDPDRVVGKLGVEPLSERFSPELLFTLTRSRKARIKVFLLNQGNIAGLGNIYVDEALWKAKVHPNSAAHSLTAKRCAALYEAITSTLNEAIELAGTDFGDGVVQDGMYSPRVYGRDGEPCHRCRAKICKIRVQQRGTHFCPKCQRVENSPHRHKAYKTSNQRKSGIYKKRQDL